MLYETAGTVGGANLYAYCLNNPIMYVDSTGNNPAAIALIPLAWIVDAIIAAVVTVVAVALVAVTTIPTSIGDFSNWQNPATPALPVPHNTGSITWDIPRAWENLAFAKSKPKPLRPGVKGQGLEGGERKKNSPNWKPSNRFRNEKAPKKHTPGRGHRGKFQLWWLLISGFWSQDYGGHF